MTQHIRELFGWERFGQKVEGAIFHGLNGIFNGGKGHHHHQLYFGVLFLIFFIPVKLYLGRKQPESSFASITKNGAKPGKISIK